MARLGDIATYINGYAFKPTDWSDEGIPIIRIQDLTGNSYQANRFNGEYAPKYEVNYGDVLISWSASLGVYVWAGEKAVLNQHIFKVCFDKAEVDKNFFVHQVERILSNAAGDAHGATMKHLTKPVFDALPFYLPSIEEQKKISAEFDRVSHLISLRKQQLAKLDELVKYRFIELFASVEDEDTLINLCTFIDYRGKTPEKTESGLPFITAKNVKMHHMSFDTQEFISKETYDKVMTRGFPRIGDVVFTTEAPLGNVCRIPYIETEFYIGQRIITMQTEQLEPAYLEYALSSDEFKRKIAEKSSGSTVTGIRSKLLEQLTIPVPPRALQEQFAAFIKQTDKSKFEIQKSLEKLETLKKALMQKYFG
jgi:type I restriction enzyme S subunit